MTRSISPGIRLIPLLLASLLIACNPTELLPPDYRLPDGSTYSGEMRDGVFHGQGMQEAADGTVYRGTFREGYWHGRGELLAASGWRYEGEFHRGLMQGWGTLVNDGSRYEGEFHQGEFHGQGVYVMPNGDRYEGAFRSGVFHGQGRYEQVGGSVIEAEFVEGAPVSGKNITAHGEYQGGFEDWLYQGQGVWVSSNGDRYSGAFSRGELSGPGEYFGADGQHYKGMFELWQFHGEGVLTEPNGDRIEAHFAYGEPVGEGSYYRVDETGERIEAQGEWRYGNFAEAGKKTPEELQAEVAERVLAEDAQRLADSMAALEPGRPGVTDVYFLAVGGDGGESVFGRDIRVARDRFQRQFGIEGRSLLLLNDRDYASLPLATRPSIRKALQALDAKMDPAEDLLAVHLVSHGGSDGRLVLRQPGIRIPDLSPDTFAGMLDSLDVRRKLIVVSACFSGHWLNRLKAEDTLVMVSAREDRTSFGCGDDSEMTWFTKALYQDIGLALASPDEMFRAVDSRIREWEIEQGMLEDDWSHPQFSIGEEMRAWLGRHFPLALADQRR